MYESGPYSSYPYEDYIVRVVRALGVAGSGVSTWQTDTWTHAHGGRLGAELCWRRATLADRGAAPRADRDLHLFWNPEDGWAYRWGSGRGDTGARGLGVDAFAAPAELVALFGELVTGREPGPVTAGPENGTDAGPELPGPARRDLVGGPLDGHRMDVSTRTAEQLRRGLALRAAGCAYPGGRSLYTQDPERPDVLRWSGDLPE
ncbi:DUF6292 family protein [Kitasatospora sp. NPDC004240]